MATAKEEFLKEFGEHYGYPNGPKTIDQIRATEFNRLQGSTSFYISYKLPKSQQKSLGFLIIFTELLCDYELVVLILNLFSVAVC